MKAANPRKTSSGSTHQLSFLEVRPKPLLSSGTSIEDIVVWKLQRECAAFQNIAVRIAFSTPRMGVTDRIASNISCRSNNLAFSDACTSWALCNLVVEEVGCFFAGESGPT